MGNLKKLNSYKDENAEFQNWEDMEERKMLVKTYKLSGVR